MRSLVVAFSLLILFLALTHVADAGKCRGRGDYAEMRGADGFIARGGCRGLDTQIQEEYWTTVGYDGVLRDGRTTDDFLKWPEPENNGHELTNSFVGYWITRTKYGGSRHYEVFGHVFIKPDGRVCGWFVGMEREVVEVCGGFRVLSRSRRTPHEPVPFEWVQGAQYRNRDTLGFHHHKIAKYEMNGDEVFYGDADVAGKKFHGVSPVSESFVQLDSPDAFHRKVWVLKKKSLAPPPLQNQQRLQHHLSRLQHHQQQPSDVRMPLETRRPQDLDVYNDPHHEARIQHMRMYPYYDEYGRYSSSVSDAHRPAYDAWGRRIAFQSGATSSSEPSSQIDQNSAPPRGSTAYEQWLLNEYRLRGIVPRGYEQYYQRSSSSAEPRVNYAEPEDGLEGRTSYQVSPGNELTQTLIGDVAREGEQEGEKEEEEEEEDVAEQKAFPDDVYNRLNEATSSGADVVIAKNSAETSPPPHVRLVRYRPKTVIRDKKGNTYERRVVDGQVFYYTDPHGSEPLRRIQISDIDPKIQEVLEKRRRQEEKLKELIGEPGSFEPRSAAEEARLG